MAGSKSTQDIHYTSLHLGCIVGHLQVVNQHYNVLTSSLDLGPRQEGPREQTNPAPVL